MATPGLGEGLWIFVQLMCHFAYSYFLALIHAFKPPNKKSIEGEIVLVTGAGHGIGRQMALDLSKLGTTVVVWDINKETSEKTAKEINESGIGGKAVSYACDVSDASQVAAVASRVRRDVGDVSILVNNAGVLNAGYFMDLEEKDVRRCFDVNILSHFWMNKEFLPAMIKKNHGHIVNMASMAGIQGHPVLTDYCSTKFAVLGLADALISEFHVLGVTGVRVSTVCPTIVDTGFVKHFQICNSVLTVEEVSEVAIDGMLRNHDIITVPRDTFYASKFVNMLPRRAQHFMVTHGLSNVYPQYKKHD